MLNDKVIMIVDDDITLLEMYVERLKAEGAIIVQASNGEEALLKVKESKPHIMLLDIMMPKKSGFDVLTELRADSETKDLPVILLTALNDDQKRNQGMKLGANDYIVKSETLPIDVVKKLEHWLEVSPKK